MANLTAAAYDGRANGCSATPGIARSIRVTTPRRKPEPISSSVLFQKATAPTTSSMRGPSSFATIVMLGALDQGAPNCA